MYVRDLVSSTRASSSRGHFPDSISIRCIVGNQQRTVSRDSDTDRPRPRKHLRSVRAVAGEQPRHVHSIVTELTSWRFKNNAGLFPCKLTMEDGEVLRVMVKLKPRDCEVLEVAESIAHLCSNRLGNAYTEFRNDMEFVRCDLRESAVYGCPLEAPPSP